MTIKRTFTDIKNIFKEKRILEIVLLSLLIMQGLIVIYFNLKLLGNHMGYDSSWSYLKAVLMWKEKTINSGAWSDQTSPFLDSSMPLASLIYGITGEILPSYGLANLIILLLIMICINSICCYLGEGIEARLFALNMLICPYLTNGYYVFNDLGYFSNLISGPSFYCVRALIVLMVVREFIIIKSQNKIDVWGYLSLILCFLAGMSSGIFIVVMILFPYLVYEIIMMFRSNEIKRLATKDTIYCITCIFFVIFGKIFANKVLNIIAIDGSRTWTSISKIYTNFGAPLQGLLKLIGVLPVDDTSISILSAEGIYRVFPLVIFGVIVCSFAFVIKTLKTDLHTKNDVIMFLIIVIAVNYFVFGLFNAQYGSRLFEERYLVTTFMVIIILVSYYLDCLDVNRLFSQTVIVILLICLIGNDYVSDKKYMQDTNETWQIPEISEIVDEQDAQLIYFWGNELKDLGRSLRVYDLNHIYKNINTEGGFHHWGDYLYLDDNSDYQGQTLLIISKDTNFVPENILSLYTKIAELNYVDIYKCEINPIDESVGITGSTSIDLPITPGIIMRNGSYDGAGYVSDGTEGYIMYGPYCDTVDGTYDFILDYEIEGEGSAAFDVSIDVGAEQLGVVDLIPGENQAVIKNINLQEGHILEYRVYCSSGTIIKINKVTIKRVNDV